MNDWRRGRGTRPPRRHRRPRRRRVEEVVRQPGGARGPDNRIGGKKKNFWTKITKKKLIRFDLSIDRYEDEKIHFYLDEIVDKNLGESTFSRRIRAEFDVVDPTVCNGAVCTNGRFNG